MCLTCCEVLENKSFKLNELLQHMRTKYGSLADHGADIFKRNAKDVKKSRRQEMWVLLTEKFYCLLSLYFVV